MKYSWSLTSVVVFRPDCGAKIGHMVPFFREFLQTGRVQQHLFCLIPSMDTDDILKRLKTHNMDCLVIIKTKQKCGLN